MSDALYTVIIYPIVQIIEVVFIIARKTFDETGLAVVCVSGAVSLLCLPIYAVAEKWQEIERDTQKRLAAKTAKIKAVFKGDERFMILAAYYRQNHYHPIYALRSSFGVLLQIPFFIAAYSYLSHLEALRGAPFLFIADLGSSDRLLALGPWRVNILPVVMTAINIISGAVYLRGFPLRDKAQLYGMALVFLVLLYNAPAGLVLYWTCNNLFSLGKNIVYKIKNGPRYCLRAAAAVIVVMILLLLFVHPGYFA